MSLNRLKYKKGDTLIEVLFAVAIFSLVAVGSISIMNQGTATAQRALEITLVRQEIDAQAETLRFLNSSYIANSSSAEQWQDIHDYAIDGSSGGDVSDFGSGASCVIPTKAFILNAHTAKFVDPTGTNKPVLAETFSQVRYSLSNPNIFSKAEGIWIEAVKVEPADPNQNNAGYIDFHIRACWDSPGQPIPVTIGTIVRLYEPI